MIHLDQAIVVEGKYDRMKLSVIFDCPILETEGFNFKKENSSAMSLISRASLDMGIVILTDSDPAGIKIRSMLISMLPEGAVYYNAYVPAVEGKEKRKKQPGSAGLLGVEGITEEIIVKAVTDAVRGVAAGEKRQEEDATITDLFNAGLIGRENSAQLRKNFLSENGLPDMSPKQLLKYFNASIGGNELKRKLTYFATKYNC